MRAAIGLALAMVLAGPRLAVAAPLGATPLEPGLKGRKDIIFFENFESAGWHNNWKYSSLPKNCSLSSAGFQGKALKVSVPKGQHYGTSFGFDFAKFSLAEPESLYFRYYLRFDSSWDGGSGGKLPGFGGTYGVAGWGGKPAHGDDGWSSRGQFKGGGAGKTWIGYYVYHADMTGTYGNSWLWQKNNLGLLTHNKWYCVEGYVKLDTPAGKDGILRGWVNGSLAYEKTGLNFRTVSKLKIQRFWFDIYYGGSWTPTKDMSLYADNIVVASGRVGCYAAPKPDAGPPKPDAAQPKLDAASPASDGAPAVDAAGGDAPSVGDAVAAADAFAGSEAGADASPPDGPRASDGCSCELASAPGRPQGGLLLGLLGLLLFGRRRRG